ncbi:ATP-binding cassette sub-family C member 9-like isoform X1 [Branchiostoma floridae]|uniref:ATP-binding cassette sub-family C member 9-like isoform X1 n=1 Tax=Branchiostoma floridae TaxID=7739 RepID=A0A9J7M6V0_BRAFL|nr:ATP-binding cassette sub-family C member 9-like isoform X1 [Branchiostoma floridae]XP_035695293.1 ATP-binding cassette sub-family C member 9-like isoform X1 [Branchiostoma floridae]XP_035695294.1 ATP-binding cassette sub-family C member 9-like isoform X1 [Branchiostoma floridae]XP_035695295.1 ATP-binding cassette sub-family C member 9-like isoform X1 [Branchiostoma floridae]
MADSLFCGPAYPSVNGNTTAVDVRTEECLVDGLNLIPHAGYLPLALLALVLWRWKKSKATERQKGWVLFPGHYARWTVTLVLLFITLCEVGEGVVSDGYTPGHHIHLYLPWIVALLATLLACVYYYQVETSNKPRLLLPLCVYYVMSAGFKAARLAHLYNRDVSSTRLRLSLTWTSVVLYAMHIVIEGYAMFKLKYLSASPVQLKPHSDLKDDNMYYVFPYVTLPSRLTFWWASFILRVGYKEPLEMSHLGKIPKLMRAKPSYGVFKATYDHDKEKAEAKNKKLSLWGVYIKSFSGAFLISGILKLMVDVLTFASPLILNGVVTWATLNLQGGETEQPAAVYRGPYLVTAGEFFGNGFILIIVLLITNVLRFQFEYFSVYMTFQQGIQLKTALQTMIYNKVLKLSSWVLSSDKVTAGQVMNHAGMDATMLMFMMTMIHNLWSMPIQLVAGCILLYFQLGWSAVVGALLIIIMSPVNYKIARKSEELTKTKMAASDTRMKHINETIQAIKLLKLYAWEQMFSDKVLDARNKEVKEMYKRAGWEILTSFITQATPVAATLISFGTYEFFNNQPLTAASAFTSLSLFNIMGFPLTVFPILLRTAINAAVATKRLKPFFESSEVEELGNLSRPDIHDDDDDDEESPNGTADGTIVSVPDVKVLTFKDHKKNLHETENSVELKQLVEGLSQSDIAEDVAVEIRDGNFSWELESDSAALNDINLAVQKGKLTVVVGQVGSGKSSLCSAILGEMRTLSGQVLWGKEHNSVAYGAQKPWLLNATLRDNITFGRPFDNTRYQKVISACCLQPDIDILPGGDMTEIGEKGINLSGGQKQRVSLARALYSNSDIVILDDPLSALDAHVGGDVFEHGIMAHLINDEKRTVVLVTHKLQYLEESQYIVAVENGRILAQGTMDDIRQSNPDLCDSWREIIAKGIRETQERARTRTISASSTASGEEGEADMSAEAERAALVRQISRQNSHMSSIRSRSTSFGKKDGKEDEEDDEDELDEQKASKDEEEKKAAAEGKLVADEERSVGSVKVQHYLTYAAACGSIIVIFVLLSQLAKQGLQVGIDFWLSAWATAGSAALAMNNTAVNQTFGNATQAPPAVDVNYYIIGYTGLALAAITVTAFASVVTILSMIKGAKNLHEAMVRNIVLAPMRFFDTTPTGRVLNRMAEDTATIDLRLPFMMEHLIRVILLVCSALLVNAVVTPFFLIGAIPIIILYFIVQKYYRATAREIQRLDNINKSPVFAHFSETLGGLTTVRAYRMEKRFSSSIMDKLDRSNTPFYYTAATACWIGSRLGYMGGTIVFLAGLSAMLAAMFGTVSPAMVGLSITYALNIQMYLLWVVRGYAEVEMMMNSVERVDQYSSTPTEPYHKDGNVIPDDNWPSKGEVSFENVSVRYDKTLDPVLTDVSATIEAGEKVGICGRTGSGKSSLTLALFRMIDNFKGKITIDGIDISRVPLTTLRSRLSIIPQDPVLFSGSVRYNLDPFDKCSDEELWEALEIAQLKTVVSELPNKLDEAVSDGGENFSVGQRQLFCLARAFVRKCRILIMDEATASIDMETDSTLQNVIKTAFQDRTVLTIAHRIATILNSDRILVLDQGKVVENDTPKKLLKQPDGLFASLVKANK